MSITSVFAILITRSLQSQNYLKAETNFYNNTTEGAIKTISSAKANIKSYNVAIVYARAYYLV